MVCDILTLVGFLTDMILLLFISDLLPFEHINRCLKIITYVTNIAAMLSSSSLLLLLNTSYDLLTILLLPVIAIIGIIFYKEIKTSQDYYQSERIFDVPLEPKPILDNLSELQQSLDYQQKLIKAVENTDDENYQSELKQIFDLSAVVTNVAFGGMIGTIFGYFEKFPKDVDLVPIKLFEALIFVTVIFGLLAMLLTTVPPSLHLYHPNAKAHLVSFIKVVSYTSFGLLALTGLAVAGEFVGRFILLAFFPIFFAVAVWFSKEFMQDNRRSESSSATVHENRPDTSSITITIFIFVVIMAVYTLFFTSEDYLRVCMLFISIAFMSSLGRMVLASKSSRTESQEIVMKVLICFASGGLVLAMADLILSKINL